MSIEGVYDEKNIFAMVLRGEAPAAKVYETTDVLAFLDLFPQSRGHTLVISKTSRARNIFDMEPEALSRLMLGVQTVSTAVRAALQPDGVIISQFNGAPAGQTIFHMHVHIIPRWSGIAMAGHGAAGPADAAELKALAADIAAALK